MSEPTLDIPEGESILPKPSATTLEDGTFRVQCSVGGCREARYYAKEFDSAEVVLKYFSASHMDQHGPGRVLNIKWLQVVYKGQCPSCSYYIECEPGDEMRIWCDGCGSTWDLYGENGRVAESGWEDDQY